KNYLRHRNLTLEFSERVNVIAGISDGGKSSILEAMKWPLKNTQGFGFRYDPVIAGDKGPAPKKEEMTSTILNFDDGTLMRQRNERGVNQYILNDDLKNPLEDLRKIPDEVTRLANIDEYNFQEQHDTYFLLQDTPGEVARKLNRVSGLTLIDSSTKKIEAMESAVSGEIKQSKKVIEEKEERIQGLDFLDRAEPLIGAIEKSITQREEFRKRRDTITSIVETLEDLTRKKEEVEDWLEVEKPYEELQALVDQREKEAERRKALSDLVSQIERTESEKKGVDEFLLIETPYNEICSLLHEKQDLREKRTRLVDLVKNIEETTGDLSLYTAHLEKLKKTYLEALQKAGVCPTCGTRWDKMDKKTLRRHLG
ncbi:hypothetical protein LCGC14_2958230, partial [marine sediment metagenome]